MSSYLTSIPKYVFWELDERRRAFRERGRTLVDLGIGSPDMPVPDVVVQAMQKAAAERTLGGYPPFRIHPVLAKAASEYLSDRFQVTVNPNKDLMALAGSKEGLAELIMSHCDPGDVVLIPAVYYPVYARAALLIGANPVCVPFRNDGSGLLDLDSLDKDIVSRARILIANYPGNPTTAVASLAELSLLVEFCARNNILLVSDLAYSELSFDGFRVPSVLQIPGADKVAVELHSCSKSFNMAGLRIAFVAGNAAALKRVDLYRANTGYGVSAMSQYAAAAAFASYKEIVPPIVAEYKTRRDALSAAFDSEGWNVVAPKATMYFWLDVPRNYGDWEWVESLMEHEGLVVTPGIAFGEAGKDKFRISLVQPSEVLSKAGAAIARFGNTQRDTSNRVL